MLQFVINGVCEGAGLIPLSLGFGLIMSAGRTFHLAHGSVGAIAGYLLFQSTNSGLVPLWIAVLISILCSALVGSIVECLIYRSIRDGDASSGGSSSALIIASLGVHVVIVNLFALCFGNESRGVDSAFATSYEIGEVVVTGVQIGQVVVGLSSVVVLARVLRSTNFGRSFRALSSDPELLEVRGFNTRLLTVFVFALGSSLSACSFVMSTMDVGIRPGSGFQATLFAAVASIIGGTNKLLAPALGAVLLAVAFNLVAWLTSTHWEEAVVFGVLLVVLLFRPRGIFADTDRNDS